MPEHCPLSGGGWRPNIPSVCRNQCEENWDNALAEHRTETEYDVYKYPQDFSDQQGCTHDATYLEFAHDALQSVDDTPLRIYTIVDQCEDCGEMFGEQPYRFDCPFNKT